MGRITSLLEVFGKATVMGSKLTRFLFFLSSYFPLALILFFLMLGEYLWISLAILGVGILSIIAMGWYIFQVNSLGPSREEVLEVRRRDIEIMGYIVGYIIPFLAIPFEGWEQGVALSIFFFVLCFLYVNSNIIYLNPMLSFAGFRLYEVTLKGGSTQFLIARRRVDRGQVLSVVKAGEDILLEKFGDSRATDNRRSQPQIQGHPQH